MSFLITDRVAQISVKPTALQQGVLSPQSLAAISKVLQSGHVLDVVISQHKKSGQRGFHLFGQFIPATVPESVRDGDRLNLQVSELDESIVLKIVGSVDEGSTAAAMQSAHSLIEQGTLRDLRQMYGHPPLKIDLAALSNATTTPDVPADIKGAAKQILSALDELGSETRLIDSKAAGDAKTLEAALVELAGEGRKPAAAEAKRENQRIARLQASLGESIRRCTGAAHEERFTALINSIADAAEAVSSIAKVAAQRELIRGLNIVSTELGNSAVVFVPALVNESLSLWEVEFDNTAKDGAASEGTGESQSRADGLHIFLTLNALGAMRLDLAFRPSELMAVFNIADPLSCKFIESKLDRFQKSMQVLGFSKVSCKCVHADVRQIAPEWLHGLTGLSLRS